MYSKINFSRTKLFSNKNEKLVAGQQLQKRSKLNNNNKKDSSMLWGLYTQS